VARPSDPKPYAATVVLVIGLLLAGLSGMCTVLNSGALFRNGTLAERYQQGWSVLFIYIGSLVFGGVLALTALAWRGLLGRTWNESPDRSRLVARRVFAAGFALAALTPGTLAIASVSRLDWTALMVALPFYGLPAGLFGYGAYRAWRWRSKASSPPEDVF